MKEEQLKNNGILEAIKEQNIDPKQLEHIIESIKNPELKPAKKVLDLSEHVKNNKVVFGVIGDTEFDNKYSRPDLLNGIYARFKKEGASYVLHTGGMTTGYLMHPDHIEELRFQNYKDIVNFFKGNWPKIGINTYYIGGETDRSYTKKKLAKEVVNESGKKKIIKESLKICEEISNARQDLIYLGMNSADIKIAPKTSVRLLHPQRRSRKPYTQSYPLQKICKSLEGGTKPDLLLVGYYHWTYAGKFRGIEAFYTGTIQDQTPWMQQQELATSKGGWLFELEFNPDGSLKKNGITYGHIVPTYK